MKEKKTVLITGASKGIGLVTATYLAARGHRVYGTIRKSSNAVQNVIPIFLDVTDATSIESAVRKIMDESGKIDVLINNACEVVIGTCETCTIEEQKRVMDVNYFGVVRMIQAVLPHMRKALRGHIINMSSVAGFEPFPIIETYVATKFALEGLSESLATYLSRWNIHTTLIEPAGVKTSVAFSSPQGSRDVSCFKSFCETGQNLMKNSFESSQDPEEIAQLIEKVIENKSPSLRYQTDDISREMAEKRFKDPSGMSLLSAKRKSQEALLRCLSDLS